MRMPEIDAELYERTINNILSGLTMYVRDADVEIGPVKRMPGRNGEEDTDTFNMRKRKERWWGMIDRTTKRLSDKIWGNYVKKTNRNRKR